MFRDVFACYKISFTGGEEQNDNTLRTVYNETITNFSNVLFCKTTGPGGDIAKVEEDGNIEIIDVDIDIEGEEGKIAHVD